MIRDILKIKVDWVCLWGRGCHNWGTFLLLFSLHVSIWVRTVWRGLILALFTFAKINYFDAHGKFHC